MSEQSPTIDEQRTSLSTGGDVETVASPLPYLFAEEKRGDRQTREALFCTFNADLAFFERTVLGVTQSTGARITVVGDARISTPDPRAARNAGTRYVHGIAATPTGSAFHPKVTVVVGPDRALVTIGSGNLSTGGWHLNAETWTVATADRDRCPSLVPQVAQWLRTLETVCAISPHAAQGIGRVAGALDALAAASTLIDTGHRLVHTSTAPILEQLPSEPLEQLLLYAPFHDPNAAAVRALIERFSPSRVALAVQSDRTVIEPTAIARVIEELGVSLTVIEDAGTLYRHGKLVEAVRRDGTRWALTGSPNLSAAALLRSVADAGNVEVGVVSHGDVSLFPIGDPITLSDVPAVSITGALTERLVTGVLLLAAARTPDGLRVTFAKPTPAPVRVLASSFVDFDTWTELGTVPVGSTDFLLTDVDLPGGSRVRAAWSGAAGEQHGTLVFVTDPGRILERMGETTDRRAPVHDPVALITDPRLLDMWLDGLRQLAAARSSVAVPRSTGPAASRGESDDRDRRENGPRIDTDIEDWLGYADDAKSRLGSPMFHFALGGFPALRALVTAPGADLAEPTDRVVDERKAGLEGDDANTVNEDVDPAKDTNGGDPAQGEAASSTDPGMGDPDPSGRSVLIGLAERTEHEKRRIRRVLGKAVAEDAPNLAAVDRMAITLLVLCAAQSGVWETAVGQDGWFRVLGHALENLDRGDVPDAIQQKVASLAGVALYVLREHRPTDGRTGEVLRYKALAAETSHLYPAADPDLVADYAAPLCNSHGFPIDPDDVMRVVAMTVQDDPLAEALDSLDRTHPTWHVHQHGPNVLHVDGDFRTPFTAATEVLEAITDLQVAAVWATNDCGEWALAARQGDDLIHVEHRKAGVIWSHYGLTSLITPTRISRDGSLANRVRIKHVPRTQCFPEAITILDAAGIDVAKGPPIDCR